MKKVALLLALFFLSVLGFSQSFMHGAGAAILVANVNHSDPAVVAGLTYSPRFNFVEMDNMSLSVGIPLTAGISGYYNSQDANNSTLDFMVNAPLMINLNIGAGSTKKNEGRFGFFAGAGFGYHYGSYNTTVTDEFGNLYQSNLAKSSYGPAANAGIRIAVGSHRKNIEIRLSYLKGIEANNANVFGVATLFNF